MPKPLVSAGGGLAALRYTLRKGREARFTLLYRNDNLRRQIEAGLARDAAAPADAPKPPAGGG